MATAKYTPTFQQVTRLFRYNPDTGKIIRKVRVSQNTRVGDEVGNPDRRGYLQVLIGGRNYAAHRIAWFLYYKKWPDGQIDHRNRNKSDNRLSNLRLATPQQNSFNHGLRSNNKTGYAGVSVQGNKFKAVVYLNGKSFYLGMFSTPEEAARKYDEKAKELHGEFAKCNFPNGTIG